MCLCFVVGLVLGSFVLMFIPTSATSSTSIAMAFAPVTAANMAMTTTAATFVVLTPMGTFNNRFGRIALGLLFAHYCQLLKSCQVKHEPNSHQGVWTISSGTSLSSGSQRRTNSPLGS